MNLKKAIAVVIVIALTASAAVLVRRQMDQARFERVRRPATGTSAAVTRPVPSASLTIEGAVIGSAATSGTLTLRIGNRVSTQPITITPGFNFAVAGAQGDDMVSVEVETPTYRFATLLGSYARLMRQAGGDGYLSAAECDRVRLSPFSTAMYFFLQYELGGRLPASDSEHERVIRSLSMLDVRTAAAWLDDLAQGRVALPAGFANGYQLLQDRQAYRNFLGQNNGYNRTSY